MTDRSLGPSLVDCVHGDTSEGSNRSNGRGRRFPVHATPMVMVMAMAMTAVKDRVVMKAMVTVVMVVVVAKMKAVMVVAESGVTRMAKSVVAAAMMHRARKGHDMNERLSRL